MTVDLINKKSGATPLIIASAYDSKEVARLLLRRGAAANAQDANGLTALMKAHSGVITEMLFDNQADPNIQDYQGFNALYYAAKANRAAQVEMLLSNGNGIGWKEALHAATAAKAIEAIYVLQQWRKAHY
jgi:ankyrin repeat protein